MVKLLKKLIFKAYVILLMIFTVWYGYFMAPLVFGFEGKEEAGESLRELKHTATEEERLFADLISSKGKMKKTDLGYRVIEQPYIEGRFHHIGFEVQADNASMCVRCHGNVPHDKSKEVRSFLNMHAFYTACETCWLKLKKCMLTQMILIFPPMAIMEPKLRQVSLKIMTSDFLRQKKIKPLWSVILLSRTALANNSGRK